MAQRLEYIQDTLCAHTPKYIFYKVVLCDVLKGNDSMKAFSVDISRSSRVTGESFCEVLLSMKHLEELRWEIPTCTATLLNTISALLVPSKTLTVLDFNTPYITKEQAWILLNALRANCTLRNLTLSSSAVTAQPSMFVTFLSDTVALKHLRVVGKPYTESDALISVFRGMIFNGTVSSLELHQLSLDGYSAKLGARMLAHSRVLQSFGLLRYFPRVMFPIDKLRSVEAHKQTASWLDALSKNDTLQYTTLSVNIWTDECWKQFFPLLSRNDSLKEVTIVACENERSRLSEIAKKVEEVGCGEKVSFLVSFEDSCSDNRYYERYSLADCKNYSELQASVRAEDNCTVLPVYRELSTYPPLTCLSLVLAEWKEELCWLLVKYVSTSCTLRKMDLKLHLASFQTELGDWWLALSQSLQRNRSITNFGMGVEGDRVEGAGRLGEAVARSKTIRKIRLLTPLLHTRVGFLKALCINISENYALCSVCVNWEVLCLPWESDWLAVIQNTVNRNLGYVARAAQFLNQARCDISCAAALDRVYRHQALIVELSKVLAVSEADAVVAVRQGYRSIEGMHEFMRLAGVVKTRVTCQPRDDGRPQLDALDEHCWARVRRYLQLDDVARPCRS
ncbi:uncharacterized protein LOC142767397 isoform X1 [Rhipicephalus microplus]|uniref:uncharacterized protein LOC142767397 isoform X1 n=1 Tax=Rhipicephalus microplus TaxID=6941 RepID=UPI003F6AB743